MHHAVIPPPPSFLGHYSYSWSLVKEAFQHVVPRWTSLNC